MAEWDIVIKWLYFKYSKGPSAHFTYAYAVVTCNLNYIFNNRIKVALIARREIFKNGNLLVLNPMI